MTFSQFGWLCGCAESEPNVCTKFPEFNHFWPWKCDSSAADQRVISFGGHRIIAPTQSIAFRVAGSSETQLPFTAAAGTLKGMRFTFPQYLFPAFLFRPRQFDPEEPPHHTSHSKQKKALSRDETIQAAGKASFTYLVCKGCHTPCTSPSL